MSIYGKEYRCLCGHPLEIPEGARKKLEKDERAVLWCEACGCGAEIEHGRIVEYQPRGALVFWAGATPFLGPCP